MIADLPYPEPWMDSALCAQTDPEAWFPEKGGSNRESKAVCNGSARRLPCPVRDECLAYAIKNGERWGVWGGLGAQERARLMRRLRPVARCGTLGGYTRHRRDGEEPCPDCRQANAEACRGRQSRRGAA